MIIQNKKIFFLGLFLLCMQLLQGMDEPNISMLLTHQDNKQQLTSMLKAQGIDLSPRIVSTCNEGICSKTIPFDITWNADGNICGNIVIKLKYAEKGPKNIKSKLFLNRYQSENGLLKYYKQQWDNFIVPDESCAPIFNEKGDFSSYAVGIAGQKLQVLECVISSEGNAATYPCLLRYKKGMCSATIPLTILQKKEPGLLQDILKSPSAITVDESGKRVRVFKIEDVLFSDQYKQLAAMPNFWLFQCILEERTDTWYEEVIIPSEEGEEVFDAEKYFAEKPDCLLGAGDKYYDLRRALKMAMWYQCIYEKLNELISKIVRYNATSLTQRTH